MRLLLAYLISPLVAALAASLLPYPSAILVGRTGDARDLPSIRSSRVLYLAATPN